MSLYVKISWIVEFLQREGTLKVTLYYKVDEKRQKDTFTEGKKL